MKWIKHDGYHETHQYVDDKGKIHGEVTGSRFETQAGWHAHDETAEPRLKLGRFVSAETAKAAVEEHHAAKEAPPAKAESDEEKEKKT